MDISIAKHSNQDEWVVRVQLLCQGGGEVKESLFRKKRFMLDEKFQQSTSKFAIFYMCENPKLLFPFFISCYFIFPLMNALVYVDIDQGIH